MKKYYQSLIAVFLLGCLASGCAGIQKALGEKLDVPPEFNQKVILELSDSYQMYQAPRSVYDVGDLQSFQSQHTFPLDVEDAFKEIFGQVEVVKPGMKIETTQPDTPAIFEVRLMDLANDISNGANNYRATATIAVVMKSPRDHVFWQKVFRGDGYVVVDPQFSTGLGPQDAVLDAIRDALSQMKKAIVNTPAVRQQMKHYQEIERARQEKETKL